jgi:hypothetical protein
VTVAADAHAKDCLRLTAAEARRCRAQAALMMWQMLSGTRLLERRQAAREEALQALEPRAMQRAPATGSRTSRCRRQLPHRNPR